MKYKLQPKKNPQDREAAPKYYAVPVWDGMVDLDYLSRRIAGRSSLTAGDVSNVIKNFLDEIPGYLLLGRSVKLDGLGILRVSFSSEGSEKAEEFKTAMIRGVKVQFRPSVEFMGMVNEGISFEKTE